MSIDLDNAVLCLRKMRGDRCLSQSLGAQLKQLKVSTRAVISEPSSLSTRHDHIFIGSHMSLTHQLWNGDPWSQQLAVSTSAGPLPGIKPILCSQNIPAAKSGAQPTDLIAAYRITGSEVKKIYNEQCKADGLLAAELNNVNEPTNSTQHAAMPTASSLVGSFASTEAPNNVEALEHDNPNAASAALSGAPAEPVAPHSSSPVLGSSSDDSSIASSLLHGAGPIRLPAYDGNFAKQVRPVTPVPPHSTSNATGQMPSSSIPIQPAASQQEGHTQSQVGNLVCAVQKVTPASSLPMPAAETSLSGMPPPAASIEGFDFGMGGSPATSVTAHTPAMAPPVIDDQQTGSSTAHAHARQHPRSFMQLCGSNDVSSAVGFDVTQPESPSTAPPGLQRLGKQVSIKAWCLPAHRPEGPWTDESPEVPLASSPIKWGPTSNGQTYVQRYDYIYEYLRGKHRSPEPTLTQRGQGSGHVASHQSALQSSHASSADVSLSSWQAREASPFMADMSGVSEQALLRPSVVQMSGVVTKVIAKGSAVAAPVAVDAAPLHLQRQKKRRTCKARLQDCHPARKWWQLLTG